MSSKSRWVASFSSSQHCPPVLTLLMYKRRFVGEWKLPGSNVNMEWLVDWRQTSENPSDRGTPKRTLLRKIPTKIGFWVCVRGRRIKKSKKKLTSVSFAFTHTYPLEKLTLLLFFPKRTWKILKNVQNAKEKTFHFITLSHVICGTVKSSIHYWRKA